MSKKRTAAECRNDERTTKDSDEIIFTEVENAKREKLVYFGCKTLQDLSTEMLQFILVKAVATEVTDMKLAKSVWKEKADLVINRLQTVCSQWNNILKTKLFRSELHRILDGTAQKKIHLEILHQFSIPLYVSDVAITKNEIFLHCYGQLDFINVYERSNVAMEVKDVIPLPDSLKMLSMVACSVSNCLYVDDYQRPCSSIKRITKRVGEPVEIVTWIPDTQFSSGLLSVSGNGDLAIVVTMPGKPNRPTHAVKIYDASGILQRNILLQGDVGGFKRIQNILQKPNGNLVLVRFVYEQCVLIVMQLTEVDVRGNIVRQYRTGLSKVLDAHFADNDGRIFIINERGTIEVVDSELNPLDFAGPQTNDERFSCPQIAFSNCDRNDFVWVDKIPYKTSHFTIQRFTEN